MGNESVKMISAVLDKKIGSYAFKEENFVAERELTVTITLDEYRELVSQVATKKQDIEKANKDKYKRDEDNIRLKKEVEELRAKLYELQQNQPEGGRGNEIV